MNTHIGLLMARMRRCRSLPMCTRPINRAN